MRRYDIQPPINNPAKQKAPMTGSRTLILLTSLMFASCLVHAEMPGLSGYYKGEGFSMKFEGDKCFAISPSEESNETKCLRKGSLVYIAPILRKGERMTRNVWVAYTVYEDRLESSHVEDMDDGQVFYKDQKPRLVLRKQ
jgi:hypothetical protein